MVIILIFTEEEFFQLKNRNKQLLRKLYDKYKQNIMTFFYIKTFRNYSIADDLTHETFLTVIEEVPTLKNQKNILNCFQGF